MVAIFFEQSGLGDLIIYTNCLVKISKKYGPVTLFINFQEQYPVQY